MKKTVLCLLLLWVLTGCSVRPAGDISTDPPVPPADGSNRPSPTPTAPPALTASPPPEDQPPPPTQPAKEDLSSAVRRWCGENRERFSNALWYSADRAFWFAPCAPRNETIPFEGGGVYFYEDAEGTKTPLEAAKILAELAAGAGESISAVEPLDWAGMVELIAAEENAAGGKGLAARLEALLPRYPGLGDDMWLCGWADGEKKTGAYVMMRQGGRYRLQLDGAFGSYAATPELRVLSAFENASEAYGWFAMAGLPRDGGDVRQDDGGPLFYRVDYPGLSSMLELRTYLKTLFSDEIVDGLVAQGKYRDFDGVLYGVDFAADAGGQNKFPSWQSCEVLRESDTRVIYRLNGEDGSVDCVYELVGDRWIFTEFP